MVGWILPLAAVVVIIHHNISKVDFTFRICLFFRILRVVSFEYSFTKTERVEGIPFAMEIMRWRYVSDAPSLSAPYPLMGTSLWKAQGASRGAITQPAILRWDAVAAKTGRAG